jgi:hypothetical protein
LFVAFFSQDPRHIGKTVFRFCVAPKDKFHYRYRDFC